MATFEAQVEALTGISIGGSSNPTQTELSIFLVDGVKDVIHRMIEVRPGELVRFTSTTNSTSSIAKIGKILSVVREHDSISILRKCTVIDPGDRYDATDSESLNYRSKINPGYYELAGLIHTVPEAGSGNNDIVVTQLYYDTGVAYGDEVPDNFPESYAYLVAIYASIQSLKAKMSNNVISLTSVPPDVPTISSQSVSITGTAPTYTTPTQTISGTTWATAYPDQYSDITIAWAAINTELDETQAICDSINTNVDSAVAQILESVTQVDADVDTALTAMATAAGRINTAVLLANGQFDNAVLEAADAELEADDGAIAIALTAINTNVDLANEIIDVAPVPPDVPTISSQSVTITGTAPIYTPPEETISGVVWATEYPAQASAITIALTAINANIDNAVLQVAEAATQVDAGVDTALGAMATAAGRINTAVGLANEEFDEVATQTAGSGDSPIKNAQDMAIAKLTITAVPPDVPTITASTVSFSTLVPTYSTPAQTISGTNWSVAYPDEYSALNTALGAIATEVGLAKTEVAEIRTQTDGSSDFATALTAMNGELNKADDIIVEASTEFDEAKNLSAAHNSGAIATALGAMATELNKGDDIATTAQGKVDAYYTDIADIDNTTELWDNTNKRFTVIRDSLNQAQNLIDNSEPHADYDAEANLADVDGALAKMDAHLTDGETVLGAAPGSGDIYTALTAINTNVDLANAVIDVSPVPPDVPSAPSFSYANAVDDTSIDSAIEIPDLGGLSSVPVYTPPKVGGETEELTDTITNDTSADANKLDFSDWFEKVGDYIQDDEDVELAGAQLQKIGSYIGAYNAAMTNKLHEFNDANTQYQAEIKEHLQESANEVTRLTTVYNKASDINLQNAVRTYQTQVDEYTQKISRYSAEISEYNAEINEMNQRAQGYLNIAQAYTNEVQSRLSYADAYQKASVARGAEGGARINQLNATVSVAAQELQRANVAIAEINTIMASYRLDIEGVAPYLQTAQQHISQAAGYAQEVSAYATAGQTFINTGNAYISEAQAYIAQAGGYAQEVSARGGFTSAKSQAVQGFIQTAQGYANEVQALLSQTPMKVSEYQARVQDELNEFNKLNAEYQAQLQISIQNAQLEDAEEAKKLQKYSAEVAEYQAEVSAEVQAFSTEIQLHGTYMAEADKLLASGNAYLQEAASAAQEVQAYGNEVASRMAQVGGYSQVVSGYISAAQGFASEVASRLSNVAPKVSEYQAKMQDALNTFNDANVEYQAKLQTDIQDAQLADANEAKKLQKYSAEIAEYQAELGEMTQRAQGYLNIAQGYVVEVNAYQASTQIFSTTAQNRVNIGNAFLAEANTSAQELSAYGNEVTSRMAQVGGYAQIATGYIAAAQGFATEIQTKLNIAQGYSSEIQARLAPIPMKVSEFQAKMQDALNTFNDANSEYQAKLQADIQNAQLLDSHEAKKIQKYSAEVAEYQAEVNTEIQEKTTKMQQYQLLHTQLKAEYDQAFMIAAPQQQQAEA